MAKVFVRSVPREGERLEDRTVLSGTAIVQPFADVDYFGSDQDWSINLINAPEVWANGYSGDGIVVAVIDTGIDLHHSELVSSIWSNEGEIAGNGIDDDANGFVDDIHGWNFVHDTPDVQDYAGHGTNVSGTIVAARDHVGSTGIAYDAQIMPIRVLGDDGYGSQIDIANGIRYAVDNGADIINLSLGGLGSRRVQGALEYASEQGVLVVAASGNEGLDRPDYPARYSSVVDNVISVGAFTQDLQRADFSNGVGTSGAVQIDAPGESVYSTDLDGTFQYSSGTSVATANVSGVAALARSANPDLSAAELRSILVEGATMEIGGSDSAGGLNASYTVALATRSQIVADDSTDAHSPPDEVVEVEMPEPEPLPPVPGDANGDRMVDFLDFLVFSRNYKTTVEPGVDPASVGDLNGDGVVEFLDFLEISRNYQRGVSTSSASHVGNVDRLFADDLEEVTEDEQSLG